MATLKRQAIIKNGDGWGQPVDFARIKKGDVFRLLEPGTAQYVKDDQGHTVFKALSDPYPDQEMIGGDLVAVWKIDAEPIE
jgi:hypothetical protein